MHTAYWDDLVVAGDADAVASTLRDIMHMTEGSPASLGMPTRLSMNFKKVKVYAKDKATMDRAAPMFRAVSSQIQLKSELNLTYLNAPIGVDPKTGYAYVQKVLDEKLRELRLLVAKIGGIPESHEGFHLLTTCATVCRVGHLMRTMPPQQMGNFIDEFDEILRTCLEQQFLLGGRLPDHRWRLARLPDKLGGMGTQSGMVTGLGQWVTSVLASAKQIRGVTGMDFDGVEAILETSGRDLETRIGAEYDVKKFLHALAEDLETRYDEQTDENTSKVLSLREVLLKSSKTASKETIKPYHNLQESTTSTPLCMLGTQDIHVPGLRTKSAIESCETLGHLLQLFEQREVLHETSLEVLDIAEKIQIAAYSHGSNHWVGCVPFEYKGPGGAGWNLKPRIWRALARQRAGVQAVLSDQTCAVCKGRWGAMDKMGFHAHTCQDRGSKYWRHEQVVRALVFHLRRIFGYNNVSTDPKEGRGPYRTSKKCPGDVIIRNWADGVPLLIDVAVISPLAYGSAVRSLGPGGAATQYALKYKAQKYHEFNWHDDEETIHVQVPGTKPHDSAPVDCPFAFRPFVVETTGELSKQAWSFISELRQLCAEKNTAHADTETSDLTRDLEVDVNIAIVKHVGSELLRRSKIDTSTDAESEAERIEQKMRRARADRYYKLVESGTLQPTTLPAESGEAMEFTHVPQHTLRAAIPSYQMSVEVQNTENLRQPDRPPTPQGAPTPTTATTSPSDNPPCPQSRPSHPSTQHGPTTMHRCEKGDQRSAPPQSAERTMIKYQMANLTPTRPMVSDSNSAQSASHSSNFSNFSNFSNPSSFPVHPNFSNTPIANYNHQFESNSTFRLYRKPNKFIQIVQNTQTFQQVPQQFQFHQFQQFQHPHPSFNSTATPIHNNPMPTSTPTYAERKYRTPTSLTEISKSEASFTREHNTSRTSHPDDPNLLPSSLASPTEGFVDHCHVNEPSDLLSRSGINSQLPDSAGNGDTKSRVTSVAGALKGNRPHLPKARGAMGLAELSTRSPSDKLPAHGFQTGNQTPSTSTTQSKIVAEDGVDASAPDSKG